MKNNFEQIKQEIIKQLLECPYQGDISDIGNEIGIIIGKLSKEDVRDFKIGLGHGISLSDGTH
jgi:hypothetical protein